MLEIDVFERKVNAQERRCIIFFFTLAAHSPARRESERLGLSLFPLSGIAQVFHFCSGCFSFVCVFLFVRSCSSSHSPFVPLCVLFCWRLAFVLCVCFAFLVSFVPFPCVAICVFASFCFPLAWFFLVSFCFLSILALSVPSLFCGPSCLLLLGDPSDGGYDHNNRP